MIILDTNVVSEMAKPPAQRNPRVQQWIDAVDDELLWISAITVAEMRAGVEQLPVGERRHELTGRVAAAIDLFAGACLPFDAVAAHQYGRLHAARKQRGRPIDVLDGQIAAIALATGFAVATLNRGDFEEIDGLKVIDPSA